ncbi:MAG: molybdenum cofactor biosynthesis protein MoaE [Alphaproteobacteria bacterium]
MQVSVQAEPFDLGAELARLGEGQSQAGALVSFTGLVRDWPDGGLQALRLDHFPGLASRELTRLAEQAVQRFNLLDVTVIHRYGELPVGEMIVLVATLAPKRQAAFEAAEFLMDHLKTEAPFWKAEVTAEGHDWLTPSQDDTNSLHRWR